MNKKDIQYLVESSPRQFDNDIKNMLMMYEDIKRRLRVEDPQWYNSWKAGGYLIDSEVMSEYPSLQDYIDQSDDIEY